MAGRGIGRALGFLVLYWIGAALALSFIDHPGQVTLIWPSSALSLAMLLLYGLRWWFLTPLAVLLVHLTVAPVPTLFLPFSLAANTLGAVVAALVVRRHSPTAIDRITVRSGFALLQAAALGSLCSAVVGCAGMLATGMIALPAFAASIAKWALGDLFGVLALGPALLVLGRRRRLRELRRLSVGYPGPREKIAWAALALLSLAVFLGAGTVSGSYALGLSSLPMAAVLWASVRFEPPYGIGATAVFALVATSAIGHGFGGFPSPESLADVVVLLAFMSLMAVVSQTLGAAAHENRVAAQRLIERATTDPATRLANRTAFEERARELLARAAGEPMALAYLDLDHFKVVNDTMNHAAGDRLIRALAGVLRTFAHDDELLARTGGDEFALLLRRCDPAAATRRAEELHQRIGGFRFPEGDQVLTISASIGVVPFTAGSRDFAELLAQADAACFTAKELGGSRVQLATADTAEVLAQTEAMRSATRVAQAIDDDRFELHCQAIAPLKPGGDGRGHVEILLRMRLPGSAALLAAGHFVPAAERFRLGERLDRHVVDRVLAWFDAHPQHAARVGSIAINLTASAVESDGFAEFMQRRLARSRLAPAQLCLELTETSAVRDLARAQRFMQRMRGLGCRIALDDFGTGFCSFSYLNSLDVDYLKVDASFVRELAASAPALAIVRSIAEIAHVMERRTIAEGVESEAVRERLVALGVDFAQGFAIHRPEPLAAYFARPA